MSAVDSLLVRVGFGGVLDTFSTSLLAKHSGQPVRWPLVSSPGWDLKNVY